MTIYIWLLLTIPRDRMICTLWVNEPPTQTALVQACGTDALGKYRLDVLQNGVGICTIPAASLPWVMNDCNLHGRLDQYQLRIVEPNFQEHLHCDAPKTFTPDQPTDSEIKAKCPEARSGYVISLWATLPYTPEVDTTCKLPPIEQPDSISTSHELYLLAGKLIWYGYAKPMCPNGLSGINMDPFTATPCGMDGARQQMIAWQNSMDSEILAAAKEWNVPAATLKQIIENETQFWAWTNSPQEHGLIQATDYAAFLVLHAFERGYYKLTPTQQASARAAWLNQLDCYNCTPKQSIDHAKQEMSKYAQTLAAYYCMYGSWSEALHVWNVKY